MAYKEKNKNKTKQNKIASCDLLICYVLRSKYTLISKTPTVYNYISLLGAVEALAADTSSQVVSGKGSDDSQNSKENQQQNKQKTIKTKTNKNQTKQKHKKRTKTKQTKTKQTKTKQQQQKKTYTVNCLVSGY